MLRSGKIKAATGLLTLITISLGAVLAVATTFGGDSSAQDGFRFPGVTLGLTAEARESLQQSGNAFLESAAGFSAYYRVPDGGGWVCPEQKRSRPSPVQ
jgi:hypothetical protein